MALKICIVNEWGTKRSEVLLDREAILTKLIPSIEGDRYKYMNCIDIYGSTILNYLQITFFVDELQLFIDSSKNDKEREFLSKIKDLALKVSSERQYLKFIGD